jgi:hypothetical protein
VTRFFKDKGNSTESIHMRPKFGFLTRMLAVVFIVAGVGAAQAGFHSGDQGNDKLLLWLLGIGFLVVGAGLGFDYPWAWWVGLATTSFTVVMDLVLHVRDGGWVIWAGFLILFLISGVQGATRSEAPARRRPLAANSGSELFSYGPPDPRPSDDAGSGTS